MAGEVSEAQMKLIRDTLELDGMKEQTLQLERTIL